jgi:hypothetical protein
MQQRSGMSGADHLSPPLGTPAATREHSRDVELDACQLPSHFKYNSDDISYCADYQSIISTSVAVPVAAA